MDNVESPKQPSDAISPYNYNNITLGIVITMLMIVSGIIGYIIGIKHISNSIGQKQNISQDVQPTTSQSPAKHQSLTCAKQGIEPRDNYLPIYIVKSGDSLLSIAKTQLRDESRVNELVNLNSDRYPELSLKNSFLETGWKLFLPPQNYGATNGYINMISGNVEIYKDLKNLWGVRYDSGGGGTFPVDALAKDQIKPGDCVTVLYQGGKDQKLFSVTRQ